MGEAVPHIAELALLDVLLDGVEGLLLGDLDTQSACCILETIERVNCGLHTSILALVQRGTSTTMLRMVSCSLAKRGMSCHGEMSWPSFSMKMRCSSVLGAAILRVV